MIDPLDSTEPFTTQCEGATVLDFIIDIELLDSSGAFTACAVWTALAYGGWVARGADGMPYQVAITN